MGAPDSAMTRHVLYSSSNEEMTMGKFFFPCSWIEFQTISPPTSITALNLVTHSVRICQEQSELC